nr:MAG TPA: hypothetical protein [Crassvirales sp.]DAJ58240.1 MAG TPA: hypothetical protein [Crassvirales sp.]
MCYYPKDITFVSQCFINNLNYKDYERFVEIKVSI